MDPGSRRRKLGVGIQVFDELLGPFLYLACLGVQAAVQVHTTEWVVLAEHKAYAAVTVFSVRLYGFGVAGPGLGVRAAGFLASKRGVRDLGRLAVALLDVPAQPLSEISYVLRLCYHVYESSRSGEDAKPSPLPTSLKTGCPRNSHRHCWRCQAWKPCSCLLAAQDRWSRTPPCSGSQSGSARPEPQTACHRDSSGRRRAVCESPGPGMPRICSRLWSPA